MKKKLMRYLTFLSSFKWIILIWLITHTIIFTIGYAITLEQSQTLSPIQIIMKQFNRWDAPHYIDIAKNGYINIGEQRLFIVFFPLYPFLIRLTTFNLQYINLSALAISNLSALITSIYFFKLVNLDFKEDIARRSVIFLSIFPTAYFLCAIYTESLFLSLVIVAIYYARKEKWYIAGFLGMLSTLTRSFGLVLFPTFIIEYMFTHKWSIKTIKKKIDKNILWSAMILLGFVIYLFINYQVTGDFFAFMEIQETHWYQTFDPILGLTRAWGWSMGGSFPDNFLLGWIQIIFALLGLLGVVAGFLVRLRPSYTVYGLFVWGLSVSTGWWISIPRYILTMFPLFILFALVGQRRSINYSAIVVSSLVLFVFTILFSMGKWAF